MTDPRGATVIHDLGYQRYEGSIVGNRGVWMALLVQGVRAMFGLGRAARSKVVPVFVFVVAMLQALSQVAVAAAGGGQIPVRYAVLFRGSFILYVLFAAAQAPEILSRDQQHRVLPLLFTRSVTRNGYMFARFGALVVSIFALTFSAMLVLYLGQIGVSPDIGKTFAEKGDQIFAAIGICALSSFMLAGVSGAISAATPRRAYATAAIIGMFLVLVAISKGVSDLVGLAVRRAELIDPMATLDMLCKLMFKESDRGMESQPALDASTYVIVVLSIGVAGALLMWWRLRKVNV